MAVHQEQLLGTGQYPATTLLAGGGWVTAWQDWTSDDPDSYGIYIRRFDANGEALGGEQLVNTTTTGDQSSAAITTLSNGDFVVSWLTPNTTLGRNQIAYQMYSSDGEKVGTEQVVSSDVNVFAPTVTALAGGGFALAWHVNYEVYAAKFNASGVQQGDKFVVDNLTTGTQENPALADLSGGGWVAAWESDSGLYMRVYDAAGQSTAINDINISGTTSGASHIDIVGLTDGDFIVTWQTATSYFDYDADVRAQRFDASGNAVGDSFQVNATATGQQWQPSVTALSNGGWVITYASTPGHDQDWTIFETVYDADGNVVVGDMRVSDPTPNGMTAPRTDPDVTALSDGGWIVTWYDQDVSDHKQGIVQQRFQADGRVYGANNAPTGADASIMLDQGGSHAFKAAEFGFSDGDGNHFAGVVIDSLPAGQLLLDGTAVTAGTEIARADLGKLVWIPPAKMHGDDAANLTFRVMDDGGTYGGGEDTAATDNTLSFDVRAPITGDKQDNRLKGTNDHDVIDGKGGADILTGRGGSDTFIFGKRYGHDTITDFTVAGKDHDVVDLSKLTDDIKNFKDLITHHVSDHDGDVWIDDGHGDVLVLKHVTTEQLAKGDFQF